MLFRDAVTFRRDQTNPTDRLLKKSDIMYRQSGGKKKHPRAGHQGPEWEQSYSSNISSTLAQHSGGRSTPRTSRFTDGKERQSK
jgi:hypothetical protein